MNPVLRLSGPLMIATFVVTTAAQEPPPSPWLVASPKPVAPSPSAERAVSTHVAELLAASTPKFQPLAEKPAAATTPDAANKQLANNIVRLPRFVVSEPKETKLPTRLELLPKKELEHYAMDHYLGPEDGLDRGVLNLFTVKWLWKKIPLVGGFPLVGFETNEERGMRVYGEAERKRKMDELVDLMNLTKAPNAAKVNRDLKASLPHVEPSWWQK